ncbi:transposase, MuDR, MULE transposase domain protein [Tanacetum coccineum]
MSTQEYIKNVIEDVGEDDDFKRGTWLVVEYVNVDGGIVTGVMEMLRKFLRMGNLRNTISGTIHYKMLTDERFSKAITVGASLILHNVSVFSLKQSTHHYLNITKKNMVKVFNKDGGSS